MESQCIICATAKRIIHFIHINYLPTEYFSHHKIAVCKTYSHAMQDEDVACYRWLTTCRGRKNRENFFPVVYKCHGRTIPTREIRAIQCCFFFSLKLTVRNLSGICLTTELILSHKILSNELKWRNVTKLSIPTKESRKKFNIPFMKLISQELKLINFPLHFRPMHP